MHNLEVSTKGKQRYIVGAILLVFSLWTLSPVLNSAIVADDIPNSQRSAVLSESHQSIMNYTVQATQQWVRNEGRFFPVSVIENTLLFNYVHSRTIYKSLQLLFIFALASLLGLLAQTLSRSRNIGLLVMTLFICALQVRYWYDPTLSFGLLLPSVGIKTLGSLILLTKGIRAESTRQSNLFFAASAVLWSLALLQYEVVILLTVASFLIAFHECQASRVRRLLGAASLTVVSLIYMIVSRILRAGATPSPAYRTNFDLQEVLPALKHQIIGAIPLSVPYSRVDGRVGIFGALRDLSVIGYFGMLTAIVACVLLIRVINLPSARTRIILLFVGLTFFFLPGIPTALSVRWQGELSSGNAYLPVILQSLGTALLLLVCVLEFRAFIDRINSASPRLSLALLWIGMGVLGTGIGVTMVTNHAGTEYVVNRWSDFRTERDIFEAAARRGVFDDVPTNSVIVSGSADEFLWTNATYLRWLGGPQVFKFMQPNDASACRAEMVLSCQQDVGARYIIKRDAGGGVSILVALTKNWWKASISEEELVGVRAFARSRLNLECGISEAVKVRGWWSTQCGMRDIDIRKLKI